MMVIWAWMIILIGVMIGWFICSLCLMNGQTQAMIDKIDELEKSLMVLEEELKEQTGKGT